MVLFNYSTKELTAKVVYYGPGLCGKTTNLQYVHQNLPDGVKGKMLSLATKTDRTLFFDFLPIDLGEIRGMKTRVQLYTVPGQVFYNETRKLVLKGADGIVFVADSQQQMLSANVESFKNLEENLRAHGMTLAEMPHVIQFNKRDLPKLASIEEMNASINLYNAPFYESVATTGIGVHDTLKAITKLVLLHLTRKYDPKAAGQMEAENPLPATPIAAQTPAPASAAQDAQTVAAMRSAEPAMRPADTSQTVAFSGGLPLSQEAAPSPPNQQPAARAGFAADDGVPAFGMSEIDDLVGEVQETPAAPHPDQLSPAAAPGAAPASQAAPERADDGMPAFELEAPSSEAWSLDTPPADTAAPVDHTAPGLDAPAAALSMEMPSEPVAPPTPAAEPSTPSEGPSIRLTEVSSDADLFNDPSLEIAQMAQGESREIVIPVALGEPGKEKRFKLSVQLKLDPIDG